MDKIKVLIVPGSMNLGGLENQLMHLLRNADQEKFHIDYTSKAANAYYRKEIEELGGGFFPIPEMSLRNPIPYCKTLYRIMKDGHYDVIHSHELFHSGIVQMIAWCAGIPVRVVHAHNWQDGTAIGEKRSFVRSVYNVAMRGLILRCSTRQLACSSLAGEFLYGKKCTKKNTYRVVFNSVDTAKFLDQYDRQESGEFCDGWTNVLQVGRVTVVKNQIFLTRVAEEMKRRGKKIRILCAGNGDREVIDQVQRAIEEKGLQEHVMLLGARSDIDVLLRKSSAFVLPSQYEGMPLALIEAQAAGLPCVSADTFSREVDFGIDKVQWLPLDEDAGHWADAIERAIASGRAEKEKVVAAVNEKRFDSRMFAQTLCEVYQEGLSND